MADPCSRRGYFVVLPRLGASRDVPSIFKLVALQELLAVKLQIWKGMKQRLSSQRPLKAIHFTYVFCTTRVSQITYEWTQSPQICCLRLIAKHALSPPTLRSSAWLVADRIPVQQPQTSSYPNTPKAIPPSRAYDLYCNQQPIAVIIRQLVQFSGAALLDRRRLAEGAVGGPCRRVATAEFYEYTTISNKYLESCVSAARNTGTWSQLSSPVYDRTFHQNCSLSYTACGEGTGCAARTHSRLFLVDMPLVHSQHLDASSSRPMPVGELRRLPMSRFTADLLQGSCIRPEYFCHVLQPRSLALQL